MAFTLLAPPGFVDLANSELAAEKFAQGQHLQKIIENYKFGTVRPEFFYMGRFVDGDVVGLPQSKVDRLPYVASEVIYLWMPAITTNPNTGITGGPGTVLWFNWQVEQFGDNQPGLVHTKTVYHVQGGQTTETTDGKLSVWAVAVRGKGILSISAVPAWTDFPDIAFDLDSAWRQARTQGMNANAKRDVVQAEFFDMGEFGNGQTVPQPVSDIDGFTYPYADVLFLPCWRWTPAFSSGQTTGPAGHTIYRMEVSVAPGTGVVTTAIGYRLGASSTTATTDGRVRVFAFCFRGGLTITGTTAFTDVNGANLASGKKMNDKNMVEVNQSIKFAALRPEYFLTTQAHGSTVPLPTSPVDGYTYARSELVYMAIRQDTSNPGSIGSLLTLHGFVRQDTGVVTLNTIYFVPPKGAQTNTNNGTLRVITIGLRSDDVVTDSDAGGATGGGTGSDGAMDNDLLSGGGILLMRNPDFESGDKNWTKGTGFTIIDQPADAYDGDFVARFVGSASAAMRNSVAIPCSPGNIVLGHCFIKRTVGDGSPKVRISWRDVNKTEFATTAGDTITSSTYALSRVVATAPAGTFFAVIEVDVTGITVATTAYFDQFHAAFFPIDLDDVGDSPTRLAPDPTYFDGSRRPNRLRRVGVDFPADDIFRFQGTGAENLDAVVDGAAFRKMALAYADASGRPTRLRRTASDILANDVFEKAVDTLDSVLDSGAFRRMAAAYADTSGRPTTLRRTAADLLADDIIKLAEESRLDALALINAPAEAGANVTETRTAALIAGQGALATKSTVDLATAEVTNKTAANIAETGARKWLPTLNRIFITQAQKDAAMDVDGNLLLKNIENSVGVTSSPTKADATFATIPEMTKTFTSKGNKLLLIFDSAFTVSTSASFLELQFVRDSTIIGKKINIKLIVGEPIHITLTRVDTGASAASHEWKVEWRRSFGTGTITAESVFREEQVLELG